ncbi:MAG: DUF4157 domain-containing protein [Calothrix sp. SM1_7_51]|nr:DUF4157 domain-containing protein [Calothrix sp. SM1_7_51]
MSGQKITQTSQQNPDKAKTSSLLKHTAVSFIPDVEIQSADNTERSTSNSTFCHDFTQVPLDATKTQQNGVIQPRLLLPIRDFSKISQNSTYSPLKYPIQAKLTIGAPGDKYEQEADRVATQVVNFLNAPVAQQSNQNIQRDKMSDEDELMMKPLLSNIQREEMPEEEELQMKPMSQLQAGNSSTNATADLSNSIEKARGGGQPLTPNIQKPMERAFRADFSRVKVHTDAQADQLNKSIQAKAFTTGQDVFFRQGAYQPGSRGGQELIAHELTHVLQQSGHNQIVMREIWGVEEFQTNTHAAGSRDKILPIDDALRKYHIDKRTKIN